MRIAQVARDSVSENAATAVLEPLVGSYQGLQSLCCKLNFVKKSSQTVFRADAKM
jgi:hypothetical protein